MPINSNLISAFYLLKFNKTFPSLICPICSKEYKVPHLTKCGHRFCEKCIKEKINRIHKCPECNQDLNLTDIEKDLIENFLGCASN